MMFKAIKECVDGICETLCRIEAELWAIDKKHEIQIELLKEIRTRMAVIAPFGDENAPCSKSVRGSTDSRMAVQGDTTVGAIMDEVEEWK